MSNKLTGFEKSLVSDWEGWDELGTMIIALYNPTLIPGIFPEDIKENPDSITLDGEKSTVSLHWFAEDGEEISTRTFNIELKLQEEVKQDE